MALPLLNSEPSDVRAEISLHLRRIQRPMKLREISMKDFDRPFSLVQSTKLTKCPPYETLLPARQPATLPLGLSTTAFLHLPFSEFEGLFLLSFPEILNYLEGILHALLAANLQPCLSVEVFQPYAFLEQQSFKALLRFAILNTPCTTLCLTAPLRK